MSNPDIDEVLNNIYGLLGSILDFIFDEGNVDAVCKKWYYGRTYAIRKRCPSALLEVIQQHFEAERIYPSESKSDSEADDGSEDDGTWAFLVGHLHRAYMHINSGPSGCNVCCRYCPYPDVRNYLTWFDLTWHDPGSGSRKKGSFVGQAFVVDTDNAEEYWYVGNTPYSFLSWPEERSEDYVDLLELSMYVMLGTKVGNVFTHEIEFEWENRFLANYTPPVGQMSIPSTSNPKWIADLCTFDCSDEDDADVEHNRFELDIHMFKERDTIILKIATSP